MTSRLFQHGEQAQAAVESAIATPVSLFVVLGVLQMGMVQQARFLADYAAYRGARAASVARCDCEEIKKAELAALMPSISISDNAKHWEESWKGSHGANVKQNKRGNLPIVITRYQVDNHRSGYSFDEQSAPSDPVEKVRVQLRYFFEMKVPFVNWLFARYFLAQFGMEAWAGQADPIHPISKANNPPMLSGSESALQERAITKSYLDRKVYVVPIYASWSMRMFSQTARDAELCR